ncbi:TauD/TfdA family dioxygenase, partial [Nostocales cyanobacterium LEGE 11386]|nr:TauD/TfdA family dioxygenase [Nostocales cyanobacterium LEGE 11386]
PHPFSQQGERLYQTGDLARYLPSGEIEYLGRIDYQVKLRGFRIELGEIEAVLSQYSGVQQAVVMVREDHPGNKRLVAYIVPVEDMTLAIAPLRHWLKEKLPEYMVPDAFVILDTLPLTPNGKINRRALPTPQNTRLNEQKNFVAPRTPVEEILVNIWCQVLNQQQVGIYDNFFELGGHSLLATQVISRLREAFKIELPLRYLFESPTVADLALHIELISHTKDHQQVAPILPRQQNQELIVSFAQQRLWFLEQLQPGDSAYNISTAVRLSGVLNIEALTRSISEIIQRHEALRTIFTAIEGQPIQVIIPSPDFTMPIIDLREIPLAEREAEAMRLAQEEFGRPFDLSQWPLIRVTLLQLNTSEYVILLTIHHIVSDLWSMGILFQELVTLYKAFSIGQSSPLPDLPIQYADFAIWQREWLQGEVLQAQLSYWKQQLGHNLPILKLPTDRPRSEVSTSRGGVHCFELSPQLSEDVKKLSLQAGVTLFMTLLAGFETLLNRYTGQDDIVVGTDVANRNSTQTEGLIGFFVNLLVLRTNLSGNPSFRELLQRVREVALGAYAHQDLPFAKLVEELRPDRNSSATPLFQVLFVLQNVPMLTVELSDLTLTPMEIDSGLAKFDLALFLAETPSGIVGTWKYNADLFHAATITRISEHFAILLQSIVAQPDARINTLEMLTEVEKKQQMMEQAKQEQSKLKKFMQVKPKAMKLPQGQLITTEYLQPGETLPLVIKPAVEQIDLIDWVKSHKEFIESKLLSHGALLFRNFNINSPSAFENLAQAICPELFGEYGDLPREGVGGKVYGSTPYPSDQAILFHNESSHLHCWPLKIWFFCLQSPQVGGETPIVDCRKVYQLLDPKLRSRFEEKQLMYVRNYIQGLDVSWQEFFHTSDRTVIEKYCHQAQIDFEWKEDDHLLTKQIRPAITKHPQTNELIFFNQIQLHHVSCLEPAVKESLLSTFGAEKLPRNVYYGDGSPIEDSVVEEICSVYEQAKVSFPWQQGDVLMLDNMLTAHGRNSYVGPRKILVAMGEMH